jgi:hypothetical protein
MIMKLITAVLFTSIVFMACGGEPPVEENSQILPGADADTLEVAFTVGQELGDSTSTFGILGEAAYHEATGNIIVLDTGRACLKEYTPEGQFIRQISRQGDGPGELSSASFEFFQMGGDTHVSNMMKQGFVVFDDTLGFKEEISLWTQNPPLQCVAVSDTSFIAYKPDFAEGDGQNFVLYRRIAAFDHAEKDFGHVFWAESTGVSLNDLINNGTSDMINDFLLGLTLGGNQDMILMALCESDEYRVHCWYPDGAEAMTIVQHLEPVPKTEEEIAEEKAYMEGFFSQMGGQGMNDYNPEPFRDMIQKVDIGPDGSIWVQRGTHERPLFDVFDMNGELAGHYVFRETGWTWRFHISEQGILAWEEDPESGYQQLNILDCSGFR